MMKRNKLFKADRISNISENGEEIYFVDEKNRILLYDADLIRKRAFKLKIPDNKPNEKAVKFSADLSLLAVGIKNKITLWNLKEKKHLGDFERKDDVLAVCFDENYLYSGGVSGVLESYNLNHMKKNATLARHRDFIVDLAKVEETGEIAAACFDKCVLFVSTSSLFKKERYLHVKPTKKIDKKNFLVSADEISDVLKWDFIKVDKKDRVDFYKEFRDFYIYENILILLTASKIILYDLEKEVILNENFLDFIEGDKISLINKYLIVSNMSGEVFFYDLFEDEKEFVDAILKEDFVKAYDFLEKNPFLKKSKGYERLEKFVDILIEKAKALYETDKFQAVKILENLAKVPQLRKKIEKIMVHFEQVLKFKNAIKTKNYALAYLLAEQYSLLKETKYYEILERIWQLSFEKAYKEAVNGNPEKAKEILADFMAVPQKLPLIELLLKKSQVIKLMKEKLSKRDFKGFFELIDEYPELKNTKEYAKVMKYAQRLYEAALKFFEEEEFEKAKKASSILLDFPDYAPKAEAIIQNVLIALKFLDLINKDPEKALDMTLVYPFLKKLKEYKKYMSKWNETILRAEELAAEGKKIQAMDLLKEYQHKHHIQRINEFERNYK